MHIDNELVEFVTADEQEYEEVIKEYEEEILVQEGAPEPPATDFVDTTPAQGMPRCITLILNNNYIYISVCVCMMCIYVTDILWKLHAYITYL